MLLGALEGLHISIWIYWNWKKKKPLGCKYLRRNRWCYRRRFQASLSIVRRLKKTCAQAIRVAAGVFLTLEYSRSKVQIACTARSYSWNHKDITRVIVTVFIMTSVGTLRAHSSDFSSGSYSDPWKFPLDFTLCAWAVTFLKPRYLLWRVYRQGTLTNLP